MKIVDFADFPRRKVSAGATASSPGAVIAFVPHHAAMQAPVPAALPMTDRWAQLHTTGEDVPARDFWSDLQLRLAYPTHRLRHH